MFDIKKAVDVPVQNFSNECAVITNCIKVIRRVSENFYLRCFLTLFMGWKTDFVKIDCIYI